MRHPHLAAPLELAGLSLPNRIVMPPMVTFAAAEDGSVTQAVLDHYTESRGAGLVVVEATAVSPEGRLAQKQLGIFEDRHVEGLRKLAGIIHAHGAAASIQIHHAGRNTTAESTFGLPLVAPSALPGPKGDMPLALDQEGIERILGCFVDAARRARDAGFDAVEVHGAHGYLASQFLSPLANRRSDRWGGTFRKRARFLREALRRIRAAVGDGLIVYCRLGVADGEDGGLTLREGIKVARRLKKDRVPLLHVSSGIGKPPAIAPEGSLYSDRFHLGMAVKKAVDIPVIAVGGIRTPAEAEAALAEGLVDLVAVGRGILADPEWAAKAVEGSDDAIYYCRRCAICHHHRYPERCPARKARERGEPPGLAE